ncbi:MAG: hypothetical protein METHP_02116 [Methanoregula sp. SKADARSKE-2]|nr:MAG: hypothetical protein METHP_02116 [Methanoregula sp. SKADARSKE-2]
MSVRGIQGIHFPHSRSSGVLKDSQDRITVRWKDFTHHPHSGRPGRGFFVPKEMLYSPARNLCAAYVFSGAEGVDGLHTSERTSQRIMKTMS